MLCLKNLRRVLIYSFLLLSVAVCSLFFGRSSASAISQSFEYSPSNPGSGISWNGSNNYNGLGFTPTYVLVEIQLPPAELYDNVKAVKVSPRPFSSFYTNYCSPDSSGYCSMLLSFSWGVSFESPNNGNYIYSRFTFYDFNPASSEPCPDCPPIPETQYGDILGKIYKAILLVPAMAFVLYLFYILFGWYVGGHR